MRAMILAAGFGTRLRPLTDELPKPLVPVLGRPLIEHTISLLRRVGINEIVINLHHLPDAIPAALDDGSELGVSIRYVVEKGGILGTGGGIKGARHLLDDGETIVVINGDIVLEPELSAALELHRQLGAGATLVLRRDPRAPKYGSLEVDSEGRVRRLLGLPKVISCDPQARLQTLMFSGVHLLEPALLERLPDEGCIVRHLYRTMVDDGEVLGGYVDEGPWAELGTVSDYLEVNLALLRGELVMRHLKPPPTGVLVDPDAEVASDDLLEGPVCVGSGARVLARATRSIIWPGAVVDEPVSDAVVTPCGQVKPQRK